MPAEWCRFGFDDLGHFSLNTSANADTGLLLEAVLTEARDALFHARHIDVTWLDALREIAQRSLDTAHTTSDTSRRDRYRINIHLNTNTANTTSTTNDPSTGDTGTDTAGGITFTNQHGHPIAQTGATPSPPTTPPLPPARRYQPPLGERLDPHWLHLNPPPEHRPRPN